MINKVLSLVFIFAATLAKAQDPAGPQMADGFRQEGKIYVVITVLSMIFLALVVFLVILDRKVKKLEDKVKDQS